MRPYLLPVGLGLPDAPGRSPSESDAVLAKDSLGGRNVLRLTKNPATETLYGQIAHRLAA